ncbi:MAG TPA: glycerophosphodiester phosphodiesterase family protein [Xanthobacteraceae bacterium]|jgi:glycerophosphoryl diester phosphodiesterase
MPGLEWLTARPIAHRGLHDQARGIVENTASAFAAAIAGRYAIECDLQITADGEAMVHHDDVLGRLTEGSARLDALPAADLRQIPFRATSDRMISLGDLCDFVSGRVTLAIELKSKYDGDLRLVRRAAAVLSSYPGPAALMSFDTAQIAALCHIAPKLPRGIDAGNGSAHRDLASMLPRALAYSWHAAFARPQFLAYSVSALPATIPLAARTLLGLPLLTWTVRTSKDRARAARWADQIIFEGFHP